MVEGTPGKLKNAPTGKIGERAGEVINKGKMAKHFTLKIADGARSRQCNPAIAEEALLDVFRSQESASRIGSAEVVRVTSSSKSTSALRNDRRLRGPRTCRHRRRFPWRSECSRRLEPNL